MAQERPCARCIKRNIGHLCHDEPREPESATKKSKTQPTTSAAEEDGTPPVQLQGTTDATVLDSKFEQPQEPPQDRDLALGEPTLSQGGPLQIAQPAPVSGIQANALNSSSTQCKDGHPGVC